MKQQLTAITIRELTLQDSVPLAQILSTDAELNKRLGNPEMMFVSAGHFFNRTKESSRVKNALPYSVVAGDGRVIGLIILGRPDEISKAARIAFWIESKSWDADSCADLLRPALDLAKSRGTECIVGQIDRDDAVAREIWEKSGGRQTSKTETGYVCEIRL